MSVRRADASIECFSNISTVSPAAGVVADDVTRLARYITCRVGAHPEMVGGATRSGRPTKLRAVCHVTAERNPRPHCPIFDDIVGDVDWVDGIRIDGSGRRMVLEGRAVDDEQRGRRWCCGCYGTRS